MSNGLERSSPFKVTDGPVKERTEISRSTEQPLPPVIRTHLEAKALIRWFVETELDLRQRYEEVTHTLQRILRNDGSLGVNEVKEAINAVFFAIRDAKLRRRVNQVRLWLEGSPTNLEGSDLGHDIWKFEMKYDRFTNGRNAVRIELQLELSGSCQVKLRGPNLSQDLPPLDLKTTFPLTEKTAHPDYLLELIVGYYAVYHLNASRFANLLLDAYRQYPLEEASSVVAHLVGSADQWCPGVLKPCSLKYRRDDGVVQPHTDRSQVINHVSATLRIVRKMTDLLRSLPEQLCASQSMPVRANDRWEKLIDELQTVERTLIAMHAKARPAKQEKQSKTKTTRRFFARE